MLGLHYYGTLPVTIKHNLPFSVVCDNLTRLPRKRLLPASVLGYRSPAASVSGGSTCSSALGTFFPPDKLPARAQGRASRPTHPPSLHSWRARLLPSPSPSATTTESVVVQDFFSSHSAFRDPRFFADKERNSAHSAVQTSAWASAVTETSRLA